MKRKRNNGGSSKRALSAEEFKVASLCLLDDLLAYAVRLTQDFDRAEDLVQDTCAQCLKHRSSFTSPESVRPLMFRILHNLFVDRWRADRRKPTVVSLDADLERGLPDGLVCERRTPCSKLSNESFSDEVTRALLTLEKERREILYLHEVEEFTYEEIADIAGLPTGTIASRLARTRRSLARILKSYASCQGVFAPIQEKGKMR